MTPIQQQLSALAEFAVSGEAVAQYTAREVKAAAAIGAAQRAEGVPQC